MYLINGSILLIEGEWVVAAFSWQTGVRGGRGMTALDKFLPRRRDSPPLPSPDEDRFEPGTSPSSHVY